MRVKDRKKRDSLVYEDIPLLVVRFHCTWTTPTAPPTLSTVKVSVDCVSASLTSTLLSSAANSVQQLRIQSSHSQTNTCGLRSIPILTYSTIRVITCSDGNCGTCEPAQPCSPDHAHQPHCELLRELWYGFFSDGERDRSRLHPIGQCDHTPRWAVVS